MAVDARQISTASGTVVSWKIHRKSECVMTVVPTLAAASQDYEVVQPRPPDYGYTDSLPLGSGCLESPRINTPGGSPPAYVDIGVIPDVLPIAKSVKTVMSDKSMMTDTPDDGVTRMEIAGGSPPAEIRISTSSDRLQTEISVTSTEMAGGSPPADTSVKTVMLDKSMKMDTPDGVVTRMEIAGGSPPARS